MSERAIEGGTPVFPFSNEEWQTVRDAALPLVNNSFTEDSILRESLLLELRAVLAGLRERHGNHPILLETEADFLDDATAKSILYERAKAIALAVGLPTSSIRISLARVLLEEMDQPASARAELLACRDELEVKDDDEGGDDLRKEWSGLWGECELAMRTENDSA